MLGIEHYNGLSPARAKEQVLARRNRDAIHTSNHAQRQPRCTVITGVVQIFLNVKNVFADRYLGVFEDLPKHNLCGLGRNLRSIRLHARNLLGDLLLFVGQVLIRFTIASYIVLAYQTLQGLRNLLANDNAVGADVVGHKGDQVFNVCRHVIIDIQDQEKQLEYRNVAFLETLPLLGGIRRSKNYTTMIVLERRRDRIVETPKRNQRVLVLVLYASSGVLKAAQHGTLGT